MPNKNYLRGRRKEYTICDKLKSEGWEIVQRTAGSHSPVDVIAINKETKEIKLIQAKPNDFLQTQTDKILKENIKLNGSFEVEFIVM